ncbi:MAG: glycosyltransferase [Clostridia bacterium]|nr:glycosyltransferase [Clostridia bacterium]
MKKLDKFLISTVLLVNFIYITVRFFSIPIFMGWPSFILGISLFTAEFLGFFAYIIYVFAFTGKRNIPHKIITTYNDKLPTVDVFICTYNEEIPLLTKTIMAAKKLNYPENKFKVYVLDDGHNEKLKELCNNFFKVNYISREKNINAKAGNINNALIQTSGELFTVLDADMICKPNYLLETVGYFSDNKLAFVQTPQTYYNADVYQYNISKKFPNEQDFFMRYIEPARDSRNSVMHIGTNAVFRRKYVEEVGLYPTNSITEDMALGLLLQAKGYDSIYVNKTLVCGLSAFTYEDLIKQRDRWARGNLQVLKHYKKEIFSKLKFRQKMIYLDGILYWFSGLMKLIFIITPIIFLLTGFTIVNIPPRALLPIFLAAFSLQIILSKYILPEPISSHYFKFFMRGEFFNIIIAPHMAFSVFKHYFGRRTKKAKFNVTKKNLVTSKGHYYFKYSVVHWLLLIVGVISLVVGTINLNNGLYWDSYLINVFWILYNIPGLLVAIKIAYQPARNIDKEGIQIFIDNKKYTVTNEEILSLVNRYDYKNLDMLMDKVVDNIKPYKSNYDF